MSANLSDLHSHLFSQLQRLANNELKGDELKEEISRASAVSSIAKDITSNARTVLDAQKFHNDVTGKRPPADSFLFTQEKHPALQGSGNASS